MLQEQIDKKFDELKNIYIAMMDIANFIPNELAKKAEIDLLFKDITINIPYNLTEFRKARKLLGKGWKFQQTWGENEPSHTYRNYSYRHPDFPNIDFEISMNLAREGSTCQLIEAGEETKKVYKVVCN